MIKETQKISVVWANSLESVNSSFNGKEVEAVVSGSGKCGLIDEKFDVQHSDLCIRLCDLMDDEMDVREFIDTCDKFIHNIFQLAAIMQGKVLEREVGEDDEKFVILYNPGKNTEELEQELLASIERDEPIEWKNEQKVLKETKLLFNVDEEDEGQQNYSYYNGIVWALSYVNPLNLMVSFPGYLLQPAKENELA